MSGSRGPQVTGKFKNRTLKSQGCSTRRRDKTYPLLETTPQRMGRSGRAGPFEAQGKQAPPLEGLI